MFSFVAIACTCRSPHPVTVHSNPCATVWSSVHVFVWQFLRLTRLYDWRTFLPCPEQDSPGLAIVICEALSLSLAVLQAIHFHLREYLWNYFTLFTNKSMKSKIALPRISLFNTKFNNNVVLHATLKFNIVFSCTDMAFHCLHAFAALRRPYWIF